MFEFFATNQILLKGSSYTFLQGDFNNFFHMYLIQHYFIRTSDSTVSEYAGIEPRTFATLALTIRRSYQSARSHSLFLL